MTIKYKYYTGTTVSRFLSPSESSWSGNVFQSGKPVLDSELNLDQDIQREIQKLILQKETCSGFFGFKDFDFQNPGDADFIANAFKVPKITALVAGMPVIVEYTNTTNPNENYIQLDNAPVKGGAAPDVKRTDFVFLEVFKVLVAPSPHGSGTIEVADPLAVSPGDTVTLDGVPLTAVVGAPGVDEFEIGTTPVITAGNIRDAINNVANSFTSICTAQLDLTTTNQVNLRSVVGGLAGNITFVSSNPAGLIPTPFTGNFSGGSDRLNKPTQDTIYRRGNVDAPAGVNLPDNIEDPIVGTESTQRIQVQYRIRVTGQAEAIDFKTQNGFRDSSGASSLVLAQGSQGTPVTNYPFVPADGATIDLNSSALNYGNIDQGLFIAGDGSQLSANDLGTVDGYVYAIPLCFVFRRNDASGTGGFDPLANTNGALSFSHAGFSNTHGLGSIPAGTSDRPDSLFHDVIYDGDVLDLRRHISLTGYDYKAELEKQMTLLLDGGLKTWAIDSADKNELGAGSGDVSWKFLVCNEIGRDASSGGTAPISGDTTRGDQIGNFDHIRRRFSDEPIVERVILPLLPTDNSISEPGKYVNKAAWATGFSGWSEGDTLNIDLDNLNASGLGDWSNATSSFVGGVVSNLFPPGTKVTNVLSVSLCDGNYGTPVSQEVELAQVRGVGTNHIEIQLMPDPTQVNGGISGAALYDKVSPQSGGVDNGSQKRMFVELEITYPVGAGATDTASVLVEPDTAITGYFGPSIENDSTQRPYDWEALPHAEFREGKREIALEYVAGGDYTVTTGSGVLITEEVVSTDSRTIHLPRRIWNDGSYSVLVSDLSTGVPIVVSVDNGFTEYGSSSRKLVLQLATPLPSDNCLVRVEFFAQDPIPNFGGAGGGYQISTYYRSAAPQTLATQSGTVPLPSTLSLKPITVSRDLWTCNVSVGSVDLPFPYTNPSDQIAVNANLVGSGDFPAEWVLQAQSKISLSDFDVDTGLLNLHAVVPVDPNQEFTFTDLDKDSEFRVHYKTGDTSLYQPTAFGRNLSGLMKHKVWVPMLATSTVDSVYFRKGEVLLVVLSRFAKLDDENSIVFESSSSAVAVYRTSGILTNALEM